MEYARKFATAKLVDLANEWKEDDDDMFFGHTIAAYGSVKKGTKSTDIEG